MRLTFAHGPRTRRPAGGGFLGRVRRTGVVGAFVSRVQCPVLHDRLAATDGGQFDNDKKARFMVSLFWAPQVR